MKEININGELKFDIHVGIIGQKANRKLNATRKIINCMKLPKNRILINAFFYNKIQLLLCYLDVSLLHSCSLNGKINGPLKRCHGTIHNHKISNFEEVLNKNNSLTTVTYTLICY